MRLYVLVEGIFLAKGATAHVTRETGHLVHVRVVAQHGRIAKGGRAQFTLVGPASKNRRDMDRDRETGVMGSISVYLNV